MNRARPAPVLRLDRDIFNTFAHYTAGSDAELAEGIPVNFTIWLENQLVDDVLAALCNPYHLATWTVGAGVFVTASGTGATILNGAGVAFSPPQQAHDPVQLRRVHLEWLFHGSPAGTRDFGWRHEECFVLPQSSPITDADPLSLQVTYNIYGKISTITAHSTGTNLTPAIS
jgi:hypothetical protein